MDMRAKTSSKVPVLISSLLLVRDDLHNVLYARIEAIYHRIMSKA